MPAVHCGEAIFDEHAQVLHTATDGSECDRIVAQIKKLVRRLIDRTALCLRQYPNYPNVVVDLEHQALQRVMLVAQQRTMPLQGFARDGNDARDLMDEEHQNPPQIVQHAIWLLFLEVRDDSEPMLVKPSGHFDHVEPARVTNERALASFVRDEVLLPTKIHYEQCKCRVEHVENGQVKRLHTQVELVGPALDTHEPGLGYAMYPRDYPLMLPFYLLFAIRRCSNNRLAPIQEESVHHLGKRVEDNFACVLLMHRDGQKVEVMHSGFVADADANIVVRGCHVGRHVERDRERPALLQQLRNALQIHCTDKTSIAAHNPLKARANAPDAEYLFRLHNHLCHLTERQSSSQIFYNQLKLLSVGDSDGVLIDVAGICCIFR